MTTTTATNMPIEDRITAAFKAMRKEGVFARQSYEATGADAMMKIDDLVRASHRQNKFTGAVFYSRADAKDDVIVISYNRVPSAATLDAGPLGVLAAKCLRAQGIAVDWNGDTALAIRIHLDQ